MSEPERDIITIAQEALREGAKILRSCTTREEYARGHAMIGVASAAQNVERAKFWREARERLPTLIAALGIRSDGGQASVQESRFACAARCTDAEMADLQDPLAVKCEFHDIPAGTPCPDESPLQMADRLDAAGMSSNEPAIIPDGCCSKRTYDAILADKDPMATDCAKHGAKSGERCPESVPPQDPSGDVAATSDTQPGEPTP